jgi:hypothetical protein
VPEPCQPPEGRAPRPDLSGVGLDSGWTPTPPTIDGAIGGAEWANARTYHISLTATPITVYLMNDAGFLYVAIDAEADVSLDPHDCTP